MNAEDRDRMLSFLRVYGPLDDANAYVGSDRAGYDVKAGRGPGDKACWSKPIDMHTLLDENFWDGVLFEEAFDWQATMFQPVGGMDHIAYAFAKAAGRYDPLQLAGDGDSQDGKGRAHWLQARAASTRTLEADYCVCGMPLSILKKIPNYFSAPYSKVITECSYAGAYKIAWESRRFWEKDYNTAALSCSWSFR